MKRTPNIWYWFWLPLILMLGLQWGTNPLWGEEDQATLAVPLAGSVVLRLNQVEQIAIGDPQIADVVVLSAREVLVNGKKAGSTTLHLWTASGPSEYYIEVQQRPGLAEQVREAIGLPGVLVEVREGSVILRGWVASQEQRDGAEAIAGLFVEDRVVNLIDLEPDSASQSSEEVAYRIAQALRNPAITVQAFDNKVLLQGTVQTVAEAQQAEKIASAFAGEVVNAIQIATSLERGGGESVPSEQVREIEGAIGLPGVVVELCRGAIILRGSVEAEEDRNNAEKIAQLYAETVINLLTRTPPPQPSLEELADRIAEASGLPDLRVEVLNNTVFLRGLVETEAEAQQAEKIALAFVDQVVNLLRVRETEPPSGPNLAELQQTLGEGITVQMLGEGVLLQGEVTCEEEREAAEKIAGACFPKVINALRVKVERLPDEVLRDRLRELIDLPGVDVQVIRGRVVLRGIVGSQAEADGLIRMAQAYSDEVIDLLRVQAPPTSDGVQQINHLLEPLGVTVQQARDLIFLQGEVPDQRAWEEVEEVVRGLGPGVVNLVRMAELGQVKVEVQVVEINRRGLEDLGVDWNDSWDFGEAILAGSFKRLTPVRATLHTLLENGQAQLLSAPTITVLSGETASILVGGRIPIPVTTFLTGTPQGQVVTRQNQGAGFFGGIGQGIDWQEFGIRLQVTPVVEGEHIRVELQPEVSSLDKVNAVRFQDTVIPAIQTRESQTTVRVRSGQAIVMGGLIKHDVTESVRKFPFLGDIPILGALFKSKKFERQETELVITVTPTILMAEAEEQ